MLGSELLLAGREEHGLSFFDLITLDLDLSSRFFANPPHLAIGGFAIFTGFVLAKGVATDA